LGGVVAAGERKALIVFGLVATARGARNFREEGLTRGGRGKQRGGLLVMVIQGEEREERGGLIGWAGCDARSRPVACDGGCDAAAEGREREGREKKTKGG
jgi:hypothetical protein